MAHYPSKGTSLWNATVLATDYAPLTSNFTIDVAVIGAGITGLTTAYLLKQRGLKVSVFEKYRIGDSVSGYTTAKVTSQHGKLYSSLIKQYGFESARLYGEANQAAIAKIEEIIQREKIDCDWRREDNYVYTQKPSEAAALRQEAADAASLGLPAVYEETLPLPLGSIGAVRFTNQATFHVVKYLQGLARAVHGEGCFVFEETKVSRVADGNPCSFKVPGGRVTARRVVLATNVPSPIKDHAAYGIYEYPTRSYIVAGKTGKRISGMYINTGSPTRSILGAEIAGQSWLLVGGEGHFAGMSGPSKGRYAALRAYAKRHLGLETVQYQWSTWDYTSYDGLPLVGKLYPFSKSIYTATGYRKWGMTNGCVAAMILADELTGQNNPWSTTFRTSRKSAITSLPRGIINGIGFHK